MTGVEKGIASLVEFLNSIPGVRTHSSCEGHFPDFEPWAIFSCKEISVAYKMWQVLKEGRQRGDFQWNYFWTVRPFFHIYEGGCHRTRPLKEAGLVNSGEQAPERESQVTSLKGVYPSCPLISTGRDLRGLGYPGDATGGCSPSPLLWLPPLNSPGGKGQ